MRSRVAVCLLVVVMAAIEWGAAQSVSWRASLMQFSPGGSWQGRLLGEDVTVEAQSATGAGIFLSGRGKGHWGGELGASFVDFDFDLTVEGIGGDRLGSAVAFPVTIGVNYHFLKKESRADVYLGPSIGMIYWGNLRTDSGNVEPDIEFSIGAQAGLTYRFSKEKKWAVDASAQYLQFPLGDESISIDVDPLIVRVGIGKTY